MFLFKRKKRVLNMKGLLLLSGGIDSPVAGWLLQKTMTIAAVHFSLEPYTNDEPEKKSRALAKQLGFTPFTVLSIAKEVKQIVDKCDHRLYFVLMKRAMLRKAEALARQQGCTHLATGESLGQVSSQTLENLRAIDQAVQLAVLRPLIAWDKEEIIRLAQQIETFEISKGKEMCDVLGPEHPSTKARLETVLAQEQHLKPL